MMTFYIVGVVITAVFLLTFLGWALVNVDKVKIDVVSAIFKIIMLSLLSWITIFVIIIMIVFELVNKYKKGK